VETLEALFKAMPYQAKYLKQKNGEKSKPKPCILPIPKSFTAILFQ